MKAIITVTLIAILMSVVASQTLAGDLNPPVGPVAPTHKTLTEVEPRTAINTTNTPGDADSLFKITQRGSYYLSGNITGVAGKHGIEIATGFVMLDLNGFDVLGPAGSLDGVSVTVAGLKSIAVLNGSVSGWGSQGIDLGTFVAINCRVAEILASLNAGGGIYVGEGSTVNRCSANANGGNGINTLEGCTVSDCTAQLNNLGGFNTSKGCTISNCSAYRNTSNGINTRDGCTVSNCSAYLNTGNGIDTIVGCTVSNCSAYDNTGTGITTGASSTVSNCSTSSNTGSGITTSTGCTVSNCSAYDNTGTGITAAGTVTDCNVRFNTLDGILSFSDSVIRGNTCSSNGSTGSGAGIHTTGIGNRIEDNHCTGADYGIKVDNDDSIIIRNTCRENTIDWEINPDNAIGSILDRRAVSTLGISGFSYVGSIGTTDAYANFSY